MGGTISQGEYLKKWESFYVNTIFQYCPRLYQPSYSYLFIKLLIQKNKIIKQLAKILDNLNYFHPFREGNGRTQREVIRSLALSKGYSAQIRVEQDDEVYNLYMDGTVYGDLRKLEELLGKILEKL